MNENQHPLILVFYLDREMMQESRIIQPFVESVNEMINQKQANVMAFFLPTKGDERIECINPTIISEADMDKVNKMIEDINESFSVGADINLPDEEIIPEQDSKPCECGNNPGQNCKCE
jgi:hypothetical protein